ncbi:hypothetical protein Tco_1131290, partial [Tanacetum coccineum]
MDIMSMIQRGKRLPNSLSKYFSPFLSLGILHIYAHLSQEINDLPPNPDIMVPVPLPLSVQWPRLDACYAHVGFIAALCRLSTK